MIKGDYKCLVTSLCCSKHLSELQDLNVRLRRDATALWNRHTESFATWLKQQVRLNIIVLFLF